MTEVVSTLFSVSVLILVLSSMFGLGLSLSLKQVVAPRKKVSLMAIALVASFVLARLLGYVLPRIITPIVGAPMLIVMNPEGYEFKDYARADFPLLVVIFAVSLILAPLIWPR